MDRIVQVCNHVKQQQKYEVDPDVLFETIYTFMSQHLPVHIVKMRPKYEGDCGLTFDGRTVIRVDPGRRTAGGRVRKANVLLHEMVHAIKHYGLDAPVSSSVHPNLHRRPLSFFDLVAMELDAEINAYGVMTAFTSHPYVRRRSIDYLRTWGRLYLGQFEDHIDLPLIDYLTSQVESHLFA